MRAAVLGAGSWGTVFAQVLADAGAEVTLWGRDTAVVRDIAVHHRNEAYLPNHRLPPGVGATNDLAGAVAGAHLVAIALPSQLVREILAPLCGQLNGAIIASLMKGVELGTGLFMTQVLAQALGVAQDSVVAISGPNLAGEIVVRQPTATVVASTSQPTAQACAQACAAPYFRPYTTTDVVGVELCGAVKNVIALAVGLAQGCGFGANTAATLITRGLAEMTRLGLALGARAETFAGLAGIGDLAATCASPLSRNRTLGVHLGQGMGVAQAVAATGGTAEGAKSCRSVQQVARRLGVDMPLTDAVVQVIYEGVSAQEIGQALMSRRLRAEPNAERDQHQP